MKTAVWLVVTLPSEEDVLRFFALIALILSLTWLVWPKFVLVVRQIWRDATAAASAVSSSVMAARADRRRRRDAGTESGDARSSS